MSVLKTPSFQRLALLHLLVNAILLWLGYYWLGVGESKISMVAWSAYLIVVILGLGCCAYGASLAYFRAEENLTAPAAWKMAWGNLIPLAFTAVILAWIYWMLGRWANYSGTPAFTIASYLTLKLRHPVKPESVRRIFDSALWVARWAVVPVLFLPAVSAMAVRGWTGVREIGAQTCRWVYWIQAPVLLLCALWVPLKLLKWVPITSQFSLEMVSFTVRALVAYLLFTGAWWMLAFVTSAGRPRLTQSVTVDAP
jgi:hypothetical protein